MDIQVRNLMTESFGVAEILYLCTVYTSACIVAVYMCVSYKCMRMHICTFKVVQASTHGVCNAPINVVLVVTVHDFVVTRSALSLSLIQ